MLVGGIFAKVSDMRSFATKFEGRGGGVSWVTGGILAMVSCTR